MAIDPRTLDTRSGGEARDYLTIYRQLMSVAATILPEWTYRGEDDFGVALTQLVAYLSDHHHYRNDATFRDLSPATTLDYLAMLRLAEWLGYRARRADSAAVELLLSFDADLDEDQTLPVGTAFTGTYQGRTVTFETIDDEVLAAGQSDFAVQVWEGSSAGPSSLGFASGAANEVFALGRPDAIYGGREEDIQVTIAGEQATWIPFLAGARSTQLAFWVREADDGDLEIRFGDGDTGRLLPVGAEVQASYRVGGGPAGRVPENTITQTSKVFYDNSGAALTFTVINPFRSHGGPPADDLETIRKYAPRAFAAQGRAVTRGDYETFALQVPGVHRVRAVRTGIDGVTLYVVPSDANEGPIAFPVLERRVSNLMTLVATATDYIYVRQADLVPIDVSLTVRARRLARTGSLRQAVRDRFLSPPPPAALALADATELRGEAGGILWEGSLDLGQQLRFSDMVRSIDTMSQVDYLDVAKYTRRPTFTWRVASGDAALEGDVGITVATVEEEWVITFTSETEFMVEGSVSGLQENTGELDEAYASDNGEVAFTIAAGDAAMAPGDWARLRVSAVTGNIQLGSNEFPVVGDLDINVSGGT